jgi:putative DNA primase/helicase
MNPDRDAAHHRLCQLAIKAFEQGVTADDALTSLGITAMSLGFELEEAEQIIGEQYKLCAEREPLEQTLARLSQLGTMAYDQLRKSQSKRLGVRTTVLDYEVEKRRRTEADSPIESLAPPAPVPWPEAVDAHTVLDELRDFIKRFVIVSEHAITAITLWIVFTYFFEIAETSPRLAVLSPTKRCGKSRLLEVLLMLCSRPLSASNLSVSAIFRTIDLEHPTLIIDEADTWNADKNSELRGILNSGHTPANAYVIRNVPSGEKEWVPRRFKTWCPIAMAAIGRLPDTWLDRSIVVRMQRKSTSANVERLTRRNKQARNAAVMLTQKMARLAADHLDDVGEATPEMLRLNSDRALDNWEHLIAIAALAGDKWLQDAHSAAMALESADATADNVAIDEMLIADLHDLFERHRTDRLTSAFICEKLAEREGRPWAEYGRAQKPITKNKLAGLLAKFQIQPGPIWVGNISARGYMLAQFSDAFERYLQVKNENDAPISPDSNRQDVRLIGGVRESSDFGNVRGDMPDGSQNGTLLHAEKDSDGLTVQNGGMGAHSNSLEPDRERFDFANDTDRNRRRFD